MIQGFDSRFWDGIVPAGANFRFFLGKATETYGAGAHYTLFNHLLPQQFEGARNAGWAVGAWHYHIQDANPLVSAREYHRFMRPLGMDFPPILDVEDEAATGAHVWATVQAIEDKFGERCMVYSARWCWDDSNYLPPGHPIFTRDLWESDPPPDTLQPGFWGPEVIRQKVLDTSVSGFRSISGTSLANVDLNEANEAWYNTNVFPRFATTPPTALPIVPVTYPIGGVEIKLEST